jgi:hypothetical protein
MGSSNKWFIDVNLDVSTPGHEKLIEDIIEAGVKKTGTKEWYVFAFRKWSYEATKWDPTHMLVPLSKSFPELIFSAAYHGDSGSGKIFICDGLQIKESEVWVNPKFPPSKAFLKKAIAKRDKKAEEDRVWEEKNRIEREAFEKEKKIQELESLLQQLRG